MKISRCSKKVWLPPLAILAIAGGCSISQGHSTNTNGSSRSRNSVHIASSTKTSTAPAQQGEWLKYSDLRSGYTIAYPQEFDLNSSPTQSDLDEVQIGRKMFTTRGVEEDSNIDIDAYPMTGSNSSMPYVDFGTTTVAGDLAYSETLVDQSDSRVVMLYIPHQNEYLHITEIWQDLGNGDISPRDQNDAFADMSLILGTLSWAGQ